MKKLIIILLIFIAIQSYSQCKEQLKKLQSLEKFDYIYDEYTNLDNTDTLIIYKPIFKGYSNIIQSIGDSSIMKIWSNNNLIYSSKKDNLHIWKCNPKNSFIITIYIISNKEDCKSIISGRKLND